MRCVHFSCDKSMHKIRQGFNLIVSDKFRDIGHITTKNIYCRILQICLKDASCFHTILNTNCSTFVAKYFCMLQLHVAAIPKNYMGTGFRVSLTPNRDLQNKKCFIQE